VRVEHAPALEQRIAGIAALDQPTRRDLYRLLMSADGWTTRDHAAAALGIPRSVAAFHLDKLADAGVVEVRFERTTGRQGPGAGRPAKLYRPRSEELTASVPARHYDLAGSLLATAIAEATRTGAPVADCLRIAARAAGRQIGEEAREVVGTTTRAATRRQAVVAVLSRHGYEPTRGRGNEIALANCPFHRLAVEHRELVCGMNLDFLAGLLEGMGTTDGLLARLDPAPGYCCVRIAA
jgi:predicted ArsR family transcriptional regulator